MEFNPCSYGKCGKMHRLNVKMQPVSRNFVHILLRSTKHIEKSIAYDFLRPWLGEGLLNSSGEKWFHDRKLISPAFHFGILEHFSDVIVEKAAIFNGRLREQVQLNGDKPFDIFPMTGKCALDIICETAMGVDVDAQNSVESEYSWAVECLSKQAMLRRERPWLQLDWFYYRTENGKQFEAAVKIANGISVQVIVQKKAERQRKLKNHDNAKDADDETGKPTRRAFLDILLEATENNAKPMTIQEMQEQVNTFMFAGHDTTGALLSWSLFSIGNNEKVQDRIHQELDEVFGDSNEPITTKQLPQLKYLDRVIKEVLRLFPSAPLISRRISEDLQMGPYTIPPGSTVALQIYQVHRDPKHWPNPKQFDPDRFLPENSNGRHPYSFIPFSGGLRNCVGQKFAIMEAKIVLTEVLRKWRIKSQKSFEDIEAYTALILRPHSGILMNFYPRNHP
ncbi:cytochrome P450 4C1 isoform X2 [Diachasma alloeum]|uniref:cytochrome P450 4C1 isoform X2 n=1 Tax=Diachasma alloeum TaxID=454923 RepID=UPI0007383E9E|nr:cytochrome P450 4C1 isoform X2 [Diachasma alloeum]